MQPLPPIDCCPLRWQAVARPEAVAVYLDGRSLSFAALDRLVESCARELQALPTGARIAAVGRNSLELVLLQIASLRAGLELLVLSHRLPNAQLVQALRQAEVSGLYCGLSCPEGLEQLGLAPIRVPTEPGAPMSAAQVPCTLAPEAPCSLLQTSGSSGHPKLVVHAYRAHYQSALGSLTPIPLQPGDRWLLSLPLFHIGGQAIVWRCLISGAAMVLCAQPVEQLLQARRLTHLSMVNTQLFRLLQAGIDLRYSGLKVLLLGGAAVAPQLLQAVAGGDLQVLTSYGMTELASQVCTGPAELVEGQLSSGALLPGRELKLDAKGQILLRGKTLMLGYLEQGGLNPALDADGWFASGDLGRWHHDQLLVVGRADNLFISGGENIQPEEIEQVLVSHPKVLQAVVVAVPNTEYGHRPVAFLRMHRGRANAIKWSLWLADRLARFKIPDYFWDWPAEADTGLKINRRQLERLARLYRDTGRRSPGDLS